MTPVKDKNAPQKNAKDPRAWHILPEDAQAEATSPRTAHTAEPRPRLSAETLTVADQLHSAAIHLLRRLRIRDLASGVGPAQLSALSVLVFGGPRSLGGLADAEQVRPPTMSRIVSGLTAAGLVRREATEDGRRVRLVATVKGTKILWEGRKRREIGRASCR